MTAALPGFDPAGSVGRRGRRLGVPGFVGLAVVYLVLLQGSGWLLTRGLDVSYAAPTSVDELWRQITVPVVLSIGLVVAVVSVLGWWRPVLVDDEPVQRWLIVVPIAMAAGILVVTDYAGLAGKGLAFVSLLLLSSLLVGFGEELMFRGLGVTVFRRAGYPETAVAVWSSVIFGVAHASNLISEGPTAFLQVVSTVVAGYLFYLVRRRTGGLLVPVLLHGLWDFSLISGRVTPGQSHPVAVLALVAEVVLIIVLLIRGKRIDPVDSPGAGV